MTKCKNIELQRLKQELEAIEKNNSMLKLIELQYQREIDRRLKQEEKVRLEEEIGEKIIDSPLRRAREYACTLAGSPSPVRRIVRKGTFEFSISPEGKMPSNEDVKTSEFALKPSVFGVALQKNGAGKAVGKKGSKEQGTATLKHTPEKKVTSIANAAHQRSVSKSGVNIKVPARKITAI